MESLTLRHRTIEDLLAEYHSTRDSSLRDAIIERHDKLVKSIARKFVRPGVPVEDLVQSAWIALIGALDRYEPSHENRFSTYAVQCMVGEIKRYFRDKTWSVKMPRRLLALSANLNRVQDTLIRRLQREPTVAEMAEAMHVSEELLLEAMDAGHAYCPAGLDDRRSGEDGGDSLPISETVGKVDPEVGQVVDNFVLGQALSCLEKRPQQILHRRYFDGWSQQQVADELGLSKMHISRLERRALQDLRSVMSSE